MDAVKSYICRVKNVKMEAIRIDVNKQMDGYTFSLAPRFRQMMKNWFPDAHPANTIFVSYDTKSNFEPQFGKLEGYIYPVLLGIDTQSSLEKVVDEIQFIDSRTGQLMHTHKITA